MKKTKTNVIRLLEERKINFDVIEYQYDDEDLSIAKIAQENALPIEKIFKTLVAINDNNDVLVAVIGGERQLSYKKLANLSQSKKVSLVPIKELQTLTGYIRGGCSPLGMKKKYRTYIDQNAQEMDWIYVNAGRKGVLFGCSPQDLATLSEATFSDIV